MKLDLNDKTALVTASSGGIGLEIARSLAAEGANVIINGRTQASVEKAVTDVRASFPDAQLIPLVADNGTASGCNETITRWPEIDILVNNLGIYEAVGFFDETDEAWQKMFEVNIMSGVRLARHYLNGMLAVVTVGWYSFPVNRESPRHPRWRTTAQRKPCSWELLAHWPN